MGRLAQGVGGMAEGTDFFFFPKKNIPENRRTDVTYGQIAVDYLLQTYDLYLTHLIVGGNLTKYQGGVSTLTSDLTMAKLLFNSTI